MSFEEKEYRKKEIKKHNKLLIKIIIALLMVLFIFEIYIFISGNYNFKIFDINFNVICILNNYRTILTIKIFGLILLIITINSVGYIYINKLEWKYVKSYIYMMDNNSIINLNLKDEIIKGDLRTEGCIKKKNKYVIELPKYKCIIRRYDEQELIGYTRIMRKNYDFLNNNDRGGFGLFDFDFFTLDSVVEYVFEILNDNKDYSFLHVNLMNEFNDISFLNNKIIIKYHFYDNSIDESNHEYYNNNYNYDFTVNFLHNNKEDNIINIVNKVEKIYFKINSQIVEDIISENKKD